MLRPLTHDLLPSLLVCRLRSLREVVEQHLRTLLSATGALCGIGGTALLATHPDQTASVFALYTGSAVAWMGVGYLTQQRWLLASNIVYLMLALKGLMF